MNREEAQFILSAVRSDRIDQSDHKIAEALRLVEQDSELRSWFEESGRFDRAVSDRLAEVQPPADLQASILAGIRVSRPGQWRRRGTILMAAACLMLGGFLTAVVSSSLIQRSDGGRATAADFTSGMLSVIASLEVLDHQSSDPEDIVSWLWKRGIETAPEITVGSPLGERDHTFSGCKIIDWQGYKVSLICLSQLESEQGVVDLHLITVPAEAIDGFSRDEAIAHFPGAETTGNGWSTAMWQTGNLIHMVVAEGKHSDPRSLVPFG